MLMDNLEMEAKSLNERFVSLLTN